MTLTEILTAAKQLTIADQVRMVIDLLESLNTDHPDHAAIVFPPLDSKPLTISEAIVKLRQLQKQITLSANSIRETIEEGRRF